MSLTLDEIIKQLENYGCNMTNDNEIFTAAQGATYSGDYTARSIKRAHLNNCFLQNAIFDDAAVTGSSFWNCTVEQCSMNRADFEFCNFENCEFLNTPLLNESFNNSTFYNTKIINSPFQYCTLTGALFQNVLLTNSAIEHSTLEDAFFENCTFQSMNLSHLNMEFIEFKNIHMNNVILSFTQMPYVLGGIEYIKNTDDDVRISTGEDTSIDKQEYISNGIPLLCEYYKMKEAHFPLANIYLGLGDKEQAYNHLKLGMQYCVISRDIRMLKYFCKLAARNNEFTYKELNSLYVSIQRLIPQEALNQQELHNYSRHIGEIKTILFSKQDTPNVSFSIKTNIEPNEISPLSRFIEKIFSIKQDLCSDSDDVQLVLKQNSPFIVTLNITGELFKLCCFILVVIKLINENQELYSAYWNYINSFDAVKNEYISNILIPLLESVEKMKNEYIENGTNFSADEIWFSNIEHQKNFKLQYYKKAKFAITEN